MTSARKPAAATLLLLFTLSSCSLPFGAGETELRFRNVSSHDYRDFTYRSGGETLHFASIPSGAVTEYRVIDRSYRYGFVELYVGDRRFVLQPIDYVGEETLGGGQFTFRVTVDTTSAFGVGLELEP